VANPFEDEEGVHLVLVNGEEQYSLWPASNAVPAGWSIAHDADTRANCLEYVSAHWSDMRPASLRKLTGEGQEVAR
jgi:MbtH protein